MPTILHRLSNWAETHPDAVAQKFKKNGEWKPITTREFWERVYHLSIFLESRGILSGANGCIFSPNNPQWVHIDLAFLLCGIRSAGIYPNSTSKDILYVLNHTEAKVLAVKDREFYEKIVGHNNENPLPSTIDLVLVIDGDTSIHPKAVSYEAAVAEGKKISKQGGIKRPEEFLKALKPQAGAFLIYTSGTTGNPKAALLSHDNLVFTSDLVSQFWNLPMGSQGLFSFLPLCHIAEKLQCIGVGISRRYTVSFCTKFENVATELPEAEPSLLLCVPRLWEKMMEGVLHKIDKNKGPKKELALWALAVGERVAKAKFERKFPNPLDLIQYKVADKLVLSKIRAALGLGKAQWLASGAAALPAHVSRWFRSLGLEILEDFGQTESTGVICLTEPGVDSAGTVGRAPAGIDVKIAEDGEILTRGRHVFVGYFKDDVATASTLINGWLHTGDLAEITPKGLIKIRGRKKEVLKTSGGKMIAPLPIEEELKSAPIISQACIVGDGRKYLSVLITLSQDKINQIKADPSAVRGQVVVSREILDEVSKVLDHLNSHLASYEQLKKFAVLSHEFSIESGEMTPTLKMKRNVIESRYKDVIDSFYA